ncbi:MAG: ATP-binding protein, partial [Nitrospiraceae bacterium]|nr:ATP-binding protein [Nitrospiraceae bacterium]
MIARRLQKEIEQSLKKYPAVGIVGSRQVGKTTLAKTIKKEFSKKTVYLDLELPSDLNKLYDPELYLGQFRDSLVIIDEVQRMPSLFSILRALIDQKRKSGRFLLLGSASPDFIRHSSESLAGRIIYHELSPLQIHETGADNFRRNWLRGGYPDSYLAKNNSESVSWREAFIKTYLERDIPQLGIRIPSIQLRRFWTMLAHVHGQLWNANSIANSLGLSAPTIRNYLDILCETFVARQLLPYHHNVKKRLIKSPKVYIRDTGLLHTLLNIQTMDDLQSNPALGRSWEGFAIEQIIGLMPQGWSAYFYRTNSGAEIDLLLFNARNRPIAIEVKYSASPKVDRGFWNSLPDIRCNKGFVVYPGNEQYPLGKGITTLPIKD